MWGGPGPDYLSRVPRLSILLIAAVLTACGSNPKAETEPPADVRPLSLLAGLPVIIAPTQTLRAATELGWTLPPSRVVLAGLDSAVRTALVDRGPGRSWIYAETLQRSHARNPTYSADPYALATEPLRAGAPQAGGRLTEPLASQLRTMIAMQEARLVLLPIELRFARADSSGARAVLRLLLVDPRASEIRWIGEVKVEPVATWSPALLTEIATRVADLVSPP